jgi:hypothetical protein
MASALIFLWLLSFIKKKKVTYVLGQAKEPTEGSSAKPNEQIKL